MKTSGPVLLPIAVLALTLWACVGEAMAQTQGAGNVPNALQGFSQNRDQPVRITSNTLEVQDKEKTALFSGNVVVVQGDTTMKSPELLVFYEGSAAPTDGQPASNSQIKRIEAKGGVLVQTKDQTATGDQGIFEMKSNTVVMTGKPVVLTQGPNVVKGQKLTVNLVTGVSRIEGGRVESLIVPGSVKNEPGKPAPTTAPKR